MKDSYWSYHPRQYKELYRSTVSAINFLKSKVSEDDLHIIDIGCGGGANIYWFKKSFPNWKFTGIDIDNDVLDLAREMNKDQIDVKFEMANFLEIEKFFIPKCFDYVFSFQFLPIMDFDLPIFLNKAFYLAKKGIFVTALLSEGWLEEQAVIHDIEENWKIHRKIFSIERLKNCIKEISSNAGLELEKFEIDIDLPKPVKPKFGTYTIKDGEKRLQISGHILMPWYNVLIKLNQDIKIL